MMKSITFFCALFATASANSAAGPTFTIDVSDTSLSQGVGSLNLEGEYSREIVDNVDAGVVYKYNSNRGLPTSLWLSTTQDMGDDTSAKIRAEMDVESKSTVIDCVVEKGDDSVAVDFDTTDNQLGPVRIKKSLDMNGRKVMVQPKVDLQAKTGELVLNAELDGDTTIAELTINQQDESAVLEVSHKLDDINTVSPKMDLKSGDISVRLNRDLGEGASVEVTADKTNVDWEYSEGKWSVNGNIPLEDSGSSAISFKRSITL
ncbi:unnamed protein product [Choristocarpus tenellus]